jgi:hypothetical protein
MNPEDVRRLAALDEALADVADERSEPGELALKAHELEDTPGEPVEDPVEIKSLLGL